MRPVVVSGLGFVTCIGQDKAAVARNLRELRHGIRAYAPFENVDAPVKLAAPINGFDVDAVDQEDWTFPDDMPRLRRDQLRGMAPHGMYALYAVSQALKDAGLDADEISDPRTGLFTASAGSANRTYLNMDRLKRIGPTRCPPLGIVSAIVGTLSFNLAAHYKIQGASSGFVSACASSGHALGYAMDEIALGRQDRMIVVGAEDCNPDTILPFVSMRVLSASTDPETASRPFDTGRDGFVGTGGAVAMVLEAADVAAKRKGTPYARLAGWGQSTDGYHVAMPHPDGAGLARAMKQALAAAGVQPEDINYLNAHATSTQAGDIAELKAIKSVFGTGDGPAVSSTKALTGHALSLSSIMEAAFTTLALSEGFMPGSAHIRTLDPEAEGVNVIRQTLQQPYDIAMSNSSGFGGANVSVVIRRA